MTSQEVQLLKDYAISIGYVEEDFTKPYYVKGNFKDFMFALKLKNESRKFLIDYTFDSDQYIKLFATSKTFFNDDENFYFEKTHYQGHIKNISFLEAKQFLTDAMTAYKQHKLDKKLNSIKEDFQ